MTMDDREEFVALLEGQLADAWTNLDAYKAERDEARAQLEQIENIVCGEVSPSRTCEDLVSEVRRADARWERSAAVFDVAVRFAQEARHVREIERQRAKAGDFDAIGNVGLIAEHHRAMAALATAEQDLLIEVDAIVQGRG